MKIEKDWVTATGLRAVVLATSMGHRCGYVGVPKDHPLFGKNYNDVGADVHGGLTYSSEEIGKYPVESDLHWFGYDCAHLGDARDLELMDDDHRAYYENRPPLDLDGVVRSLAYCTRECESLAEQLCVSQK